MCQAPDVRRPPRRAFMQGVGVAGLGLLVGCGRLPWQSQPSARIPRLGYLGIGWLAEYGEAFRRGLQALGYVEGESIVTEYRITEGSPQGLPALAAELVSLPVDIIMAASGYAVVAAREATTSIPIVMMASG